MLILHIRRHLIRIITYFNCQTPTCIYFQRYTHAMGMYQYAIKSYLDRIPWVWYKITLICIAYWQILTYLYTFVQFGYRLSIFIWNEIWIVFYSLICIHSLERYATTSAWYVACKAYLSCLTIKVKDLGAGGCIWPTQRRDYLRIQH